MLTRLRRFHRDEGGSIFFILVFGAVAFVALVGLVMSTGDQAARKVQMQNAADAAVASGGAWVARGLNLTSGINVIQSQLAAGAIVLNAFADTLEYSLPLMYAELAAYEACAATLFGAAVCVPLATLVGIQIAAVEVLQPIISEIAELLAECPNGLFWIVAKALEYVSTGAHYAFFAIAFAETNSVARANGADGAVLVPGPLFHGSLSFDSLTLPTKQAEFPALCDPMDVGSPDAHQRGYSPLIGYPEGQGPYRLGRCRLFYLATVLTGIPPVGSIIFPLLAAAQKAQLCEGADWEPQEFEVRRPARDLQECRQLGGRAKWSRVTIVTRRFAGPLDNPRAWFEAKIPPDPDPAQLRGDPDFASVTGTKGGWVSCSVTPPGFQRKPGEYWRIAWDDDERRYTLDVFTLEESEVVTKEKWEDNPSGGSCDRVPKPYLLADEDDALRYLVVAWRGNERIFFSPAFQEDPPQSYTYAQSEVYNGISADTFSQDWRVRLERASLLESPFEGAGLGQLAEATGFLTRFLGDQGMDLGSGTVANH